MTTSISTGTGLALLAGAIVFHAFMSLGTGSMEPKAEAAWTPVFIPAALDPTQSQGSVRDGIPAQAAQAQGAAGAAHVVGIAAVPTPSSGSGTVLFRAWSNGNIDRRLINSAAGLSYQNGWQGLQNPSTP
ncbi:MAG: hypothetical protein FJ260_07155 [Planctomycetes bacterium]|nr:hypothetical protein [Planctomycetota bacterium]